MRILVKCLVWKFGNEEVLSWVCRRHY